MTIKSREENQKLNKQKASAYPCCYYFQSCISIPGRSTRKQHPSSERGENVLVSIFRCSEPIRTEPQTRRTLRLAHSRQKKVIIIKIRRCNTPEYQNRGTRGTRSCSICRPLTAPELTYRIQILRHTKYSKVIDNFRFQIRQFNYQLGYDTEWYAWLQTKLFTYTWFRKNKRMVSRWWMSPNIFKINPFEIGIARDLPFMNRVPKFTWSRFSYNTIHWTYYCCPSIEVIKGLSY